MRWNEEARCPENTGLVLPATRSHLWVLFSPTYLIRLSKKKSVFLVTSVFRARVDTLQRGIAHFRELPIAGCLVCVVRPLGLMILGVKPKLLAAVLKSVGQGRITSAPLHVFGQQYGFEPGTLDDMDLIAPGPVTRLLGKNVTNLFGPGLLSHRSALSFDEWRSCVSRLPLLLSPRAALLPALHVRASGREGIHAR